MAAYFHGDTELQGRGSDGLQTLILMNPGYVGYSDDQPSPPVSNNFVFVNSNFTGNGHDLHHAQPASREDQQDMSAFHGFFPRLQSNLYNQQIEMAVARDVPRSHRGLSLSLSSQLPVGFGSFGFDREAPSQPLVSAGSQPLENDNRVSGESPSSASAVSNSVNGVLLSSKYLKATQELLDEVVKVEKPPEPDQPKKIVESSSAAAAASGDGKRGTELTAAERHETQMKKAKLINMLDKVEQRYRDYHRQMKLIISWFEQASGMGSSRTYTSLALETISKQFRCLKDAILAQIRAASTSLGEEDAKYMDNQIRQQRALKQLGMIKHTAWRPQRGLPERSVSVLRAWLFENFLHPYPKDSDKIMLAKQTGLTRSQVSNWFINARVRLWKPMVEEMYMEEIKEQETPESEDKTSKNDSSPVIEMPIISQGSPKNQHNSDMLESLTRDRFTNVMGGFGSYPISELGRLSGEQFQGPYSGNGVSLTLGLPDNAKERYWQGQQF